MFYNMAVGSTLDSYQFRIGGRYFPPSPVQCSNVPLGTNGGAEAFIELEKCLNQMGDYRLSTAVNAARWAQPIGTANQLQSTSTSESDGQTAISGYNADGSTINVFQPLGTSAINGSSFFVMVSFHMINISLLIWKLRAVWKFQV